MLYVSGSVRDAYRENSCWGEGGGGGWAWFFAECNYSSHILTMRYYNATESIFYGTSTHLRLGVVINMWCVVIIILPWLVCTPAGRSL